MQKSEILLYIFRYIAQKNVSLHEFGGEMTHIETIKHEGIVESIGTESCSVRILQASACSSCEARKLCRSSESKEKLIEVRGHYPTLHVGDNVTLVGSVRQGLRASVLAYVVPLVLMLIALIVGIRFGGEGTGALAALLVLALYYGVLYLTRDKLGKQFEFSLTPRGPQKHSVPRCQTQRVASVDTTCRVRRNDVPHF